MIDSRRGDQMTRSSPSREIARFDEAMLGVHSVSGKTMERNLQRTLDQLDEDSWVKCCLRDGVLPAISFATSDAYNLGYVEYQAYRTYQIIAHREAKYALESHDLEKATRCEECENVQVHPHHTNYLKPLA